MLLGLDGEFSLPHSTSAQAIEKGIRVAMDEINRAGGVLGGRPLVLVALDNRSIPARGVRNFEKFARMKDLVAVIGGRFSPVLIEEAPLARDLRLPLLAAWSAADPVVKNGTSPNFVFRLSLYDSLAMPVMLSHAAARGLRRVGLLLLNSGWGRSNLKAAEAWMKRHPAVTKTATVWFNFGEMRFAEKYEELRASGAEAVILVANDVEGAALVRAVAARPPGQRIPVISHWGVTGGNFVDLAGGAAALEAVDFAVVQTFSFFSADPEAAARVMKVARRLFGVARFEDVESPVGFAHAYDLTHILARAIEIAGTTERVAVRDALEQVRDYRGLVRYFARPFAPDRHEALTAEDVFMARYRPDGVLVPLPKAAAGRN